MEEKKKYLFPVKRALSDNVLETNFWKCLYDAAEENLHYWIILPNNVKPIEVRPAKVDELMVIGHYLRMDDSPFLEIFVAYEYCNFEMNVSDWVKKKLHKLGYSIEDYRTIDDIACGSYMDALTSTKLNDEETLIARVTSMKDSVSNGNGANYFMAMARCFEKDYEQLADTIFQIVAHWDLTNKSQWQIGELLQKFSLPDDDPVEFYVPKSWDFDFSNESLTTEAPHFIFSHIKDGHNGLINAFFFESNSAENYEEIFMMFFDRFSQAEEEGFKIELDEFETVKQDEIKNPVIHDLYRTSGTIENEEKNFLANVQVTIIKTKKGWYYFDMVGSKPNTENYYWEENKRCLEMIINSFNNLAFEEIEEDRDDDQDMAADFDDSDIPML